MKPVTLKDVAKAAGVSYATVSRALSGSSQIGSEPRERLNCLFRAAPRRL